MKKITFLFIITFLICGATSQAQYLSEGFEAGVPPTGWAIFDNGVGTEQSWGVSTISYSGTNAAFVRWENSGVLNEDWLVTSLIDLTGSANASLSFFTRQAFGQDYNSEYQIRVSTNSQTNPADFTVVQTWDETTLNAIYNVYEEKIVDLSAYDGQSIYIAFVLLNDDGDSWFVDDVLVQDLPSCSEISGVFADIVLGDELRFSWTPATIGPPVGYNWEIVAAGAGQGNSIAASGSTNSTNATSGTALTPDTSYDIYIQTDCGSEGMSGWAGPFGLTTLDFIPVANDLCEGAISVNVQGDVSTAIDAAYAPGSVADTANTTVFGLVCSGFTGNAIDDVWYSFVADAADVNITADTNFDAVLTLFSGDCNNLVQLDCADDVDSGLGGIEEINASGLTIGETYYFRVYSWSGGSPANPAFEFAVWTPQTLSNADIMANTSFTYFPNPVKNTLSLKAQNNIESVTVFNMLGQAVISTAPNSMESDLDMQSLRSGTYFAQVTINNVTKTIKVLKQ